MTGGDPKDDELNAALSLRPRHQAPAALQRRIAALAEHATPARRTARVWRWMTPIGSACAAGLLVFILVRPPHDGAGPESAMVTEAVNDHLRVVDSAHPIEIESGGIHQVKPWFTGRVDFAPRIEFSGDAEFPLAGGSLGYFRDRKAAVFVFNRRLHKITLLVFPSERLPWPSSGLKQLGPLSVAEQSSRGFGVLLWREGELGYALVSDASVDELEKLATRINHP